MSQGGHVDLVLGRKTIRDVPLQTEHGPWLSRGGKALSTSRGAARKCAQSICKMGWSDIFMPATVFIVSSLLWSTGQTQQPQDLSIARCGVSFS